ncbi:hypothetical protein GCM10022206_71110 [Streptomyces chiangmaiensis]
MSAGAWAFCWLIDLFFRAGRVTGASESRGGGAAKARPRPAPAPFSEGGVCSGAAAFIGRASQVRLNQWLRRHDVRDSGEGLADVYGGAEAYGGTVRPACAVPDRGVWGGSSCAAENLLSDVNRSRGLVR